MRFLCDPLVSHVEEEVSFTAMECKAVTLLNQICDFVLLWNPSASDSYPSRILALDDLPLPLKGLDPSSKKVYFDDLLRRSRVIDKFHGTIAPVTLGGSTESNAQLLVVHTYIRLATIRLGIFDSWKGKRLESALAIANMLDDIDVSTIGYMHPVVGVSRCLIERVLSVESPPPPFQKLLTAAARVLLDELKSTTDTRYEEEIFRALDSLESVVMISATNCPFIGTLFQSLRVSEPSTHAVPRVGAEHASFETEKLNLVG